MSTEDFNQQEVKTINDMVIEARKSLGIPVENSEAFFLATLIKTLINNGSLTSKQVQQTLKEIT